MIFLMIFLHLSEWQEHASINVPVHPSTPVQQTVKNKNTPQGAQKKTVLQWLEQQCSVSAPRKDWIVFSQLRSLDNSKCPCILLHRKQSMDSILTTANTGTPGHIISHGWFQRQYQRAVQLGAAQYLESLDTTPVNDTDWYSPNWAPHDSVYISCPLSLAPRHLSTLCLSARLRF